MAGVVHVPWYATGFRGDELEQWLGQVTPSALRYGARSYHVYRYHDDRYKFLQAVEFESKDDFERWWAGPEMTDFRIMTSSYYQVPVLYGWTDLIVSGQLDPQPLHSAVSDQPLEGDMAG